MIFVLSSIAFATTCPVVVQTMEAYEPRTTNVVWDAPAGWPKAKIAALKPSERAKIERYKSTFKKYPLETQLAILAHRLPEQADEVAVKLAWGEPDYFWKDDQGCRALLYAVEREHPHRVRVCDAEVDEVVPLLRTIPCEVLQATVGRVQADKKRFARLTLDQQLDVLAKHRAPWMDADALKLAFGDRNTKSQGSGPIRAPAAPRAGDVVTASTPPVAIASVPTPAPAAPTPTPATPTPTPAAPTPAPAAPTPAPAVAPPPPSALTPAEPIEAPAAQPGPASAPAGSRAAPRYETRSLGTWSWTSVCGELSFDFDLDLGEGYLVTATARPGEGRIVRYVTRGKALHDDTKLRMLGFAEGAVEQDALSLELGAWPVAACRGVAMASTP